MSELELRPLFSFPRLIAGGLGDLSLGDVGEVAAKGFAPLAAVRGTGGGGGGGVIFFREFRRSSGVGTRLQVGWRTGRPSTEVDI